MGVFEKALIFGEDILPFIPQRAPIVMVDSYFGRFNECSYTGFTPKHNNIFCKDGFFQEVGVIEHIAQSAAVSVGVEYVQKGLDVPIGFIGAVSKFKIFRLPRIGETLHTITREIQNFKDISLIFSQAKIGDEVVAEGELKIFLQNDNE